MKLNLVPLYSPIHKNSQNIIKEDLLFIDEINNFLADEDLVIIENAKDALFNVILIGSGGTEALFLKHLSQEQEPYVILSTSRNNSLPAALEIKTYLENHNKLCFLLSGEENHIASMLKHIATIISAYHNLKDNNLGVIGGASSWLISSPIEPKVIYQNYKINVVKIKMNELYDLIDELENEMLDQSEIPHANELINKYQDKEVIQIISEKTSKIMRHLM